ncbi:MAG TPA: DNA glycosylase [Clostridia bacterium]
MSNHEYKSYNIIEEKERIIIKNVRDFDPVHVLECGQCFRWIKSGSGYTGVAGKKAVRLEFDEGDIIIYNSNFNDFVSLWYDYFDLGRDYTAIKEALKKDSIMEEAIKFGSGIRIVNQDIWEVLISFIISANNRIPMIMKVVDSISKDYGEKLYFEGNEYFTFPGTDKITETTLEKLEVCKGGFRCKYIMDTAYLVENGTIKLYELKNMSTPEARNTLMKLPGVGPKVADCVLLYSGTKQDVFPTDVWVKRVMEELYFKKETSFKKIQEFAAQNFGELAGFAQQYLFYYARENRIGAKS